MNHYEILGVPESASQREIKKKYRELVKLYHPDVNPVGADRFKEIQEAYETLKDEKLRASYDIHLVFAKLSGVDFFGSKRPTYKPPKVSKHPLLTMNFRALVKQRQKYYHGSDIYKALIYASDYYKGETASAGFKKFAEIMRTMYNEK